MKFHRIPQDPDLRHDWLVSIKKPITVSETPGLADYTLKEVRKLLIAHFQVSSLGVSP